MATRIREVYECDFTGAEVNGLITETFTVGGASYDIDLGPDSARRYAAVLEPYREAAHPAVGAAGQVNGTREVQAAKPDRSQNHAIRVWWGKNWVAADLPAPKLPRGVIPRVVSEAFQQHQGMQVRAGRRGRTVT